MYKSIIVFLVSILLPKLLFAQVEIHIAPDGTAAISDNDAGTQNNPYSLEYVLSEASLFFGIATDSDTDAVTSLILHHGAYGENFETDKTIFLQNRYNLVVRSADSINPVTIKAEQNLTQALDGSSTDLLFTIRDSENVTVKDIIFEGINIADTTVTGYSLVNFGYNDDLTIENLTIQNNSGISGRGLWLFGWGNNTIIRNCTLNNMGWTENRLDNPASNGIINCVGYSGALIQGDENENPYQNLLIEDCNFIDLITGCNETLTITGNVKNFTIRNNTLVDNTNIGIAIAGHYVEDCEFLLDDDGNFVLDDDGEKIIVCEPLTPENTQARIGIVRDNKVFNSQFVGDYAAGGIYCDGCRDVVIEKNLVQNCDVGISIGCENGGGLSASNVTVINNLIKENAKGGLYIGSSLNILNTGEPPSSVINCKIRNNTFYKNGEIAQPNAEIFVSRSENNEFYNNILHMRNGGFGVSPFCGQPFSNFTMDYNLFYRDNGIDGNWANENPECIEPNSNLDGNENSIFGNPEFVDINTNNFDIQQASAAINMGDPNTITLTTDFLGGFYYNNDDSDIELDYDDNFRIFNSLRVDAGAYESIFEPLSVNTPDNVSNSITVYPNAFQTDINIEIVDNYLGTISMTLHNLQGQLLESFSFEKTNEDHTENIDFRYVSTGLYFLEIRIGDNVKRIKLLKK